MQRVRAPKLDAARARLRAPAACARAPILGADTTVALAGAILGKPADADDAARMLRALSGRTHRVLTAVAVVDADGALLPRCAIRLATCASRAARTPRSQRYVASGEPFGKAGAYAIQGRAAALIEHIDGQLLRHHGLAAVRDGRAAPARRRGVDVLTTASMTKTS